jgi:hypothetical protein
MRNARYVPGRLLRTAGASLMVPVAVGLLACSVPAEPSVATRTVAPESPIRPTSPSPSFVRPTPRPSPTFLIYEVRRGDSLISIGRLFGTNGRSIAYWNRDRYPSLDPDSATYEPDRIEIGWLLRLIPTEVVDEEDLPDPSADPTPSPTAAG